MLLRQGTFYGQRVLRARDGREAGADLTFHAPCPAESQIGFVRGSRRRQILLRFSGETEVQGHDSVARVGRGSLL